MLRAAGDSKFAHPRLVFHQPLAYGRLLSNRQSASEMALHSGVDVYEEAEAKRDASRAAGTEDTSSRAYHAAMESPLLFDASMESANLLKAVQVRCSVPHVRL